MKKITETKFYRHYLFVLKVVKSCKTSEQLKSASKLFWNFTHQSVDNVGFFASVDMYPYLRLIAGELDARKLVLS